MRYEVDSFKATIRGDGGFGSTDNVSDDVSVSDSTSGCASTK